jgi:hypothetical protein
MVCKESDDTIENEYDSNPEENALMQMLITLTQQSNEENTGTETGGYNYYYNTINDRGNHEL